MEIVLTEFAITELNIINSKYGDEESPFCDDWDEMSNEEQLITDAGLYSDGAYEENEFDDLDTWCRVVGPMEYEQTYLNTHPNAVREKINEMLRLGLIEIKDQDYKTNIHIFN